jgi:hypothetical protein
MEIEGGMDTAHTITQVLGQSTSFYFNRCQLLKVQNDDKFGYSFVLGSSFSLRAFNFNVKGGGTPVFLIQELVLKELDQVKSIQNLYTKLKPAKALLYCPQKLLHRSLSFSLSSTVLELNRRQSTGLRLGSADLFLTTPSRLRISKRVIIASP